MTPLAIRCKQMKYYQVNVTWQNGLQHSYSIDEKLKQIEEQKLDQYKHLKTYNIQEIDLTTQKSIK